MQKINNAESGSILYELIQEIIDNTSLLSEIDGAVADGDHGINMNKGFSLCKAKLDTMSSFSFTEGLQTLGTILLTEIGGSMGPLYGSLFRGMAKAAKGKEFIDAATFDSMLSLALEKVEAIGNAHVGDKTMMDTLIPAAEAFHNAASCNASFDDALDQMCHAADKGRDSTRDMVAKIGRAARLGERSKGVLDAGAVSCCIIMNGIAKGIKERLI